MILTDRQIREREYHVEHAKGRTGYLDFKVVTSTRRRWWNAYWDMWTFINKFDLEGKRILVVGCGDGGDALYFAYSKATVEAFDLSPEMLEHGKRRVAESGSAVTFTVAVAENMPYSDESFDLIFVRDILHHVEISETMAEISRVAKPGALLVMNEIYSHSMTDKIRHSRVVDKVLYPRMRSFVYGNAKPYITADERKMNERDIALVSEHTVDPSSRYFNLFVNRLLPDSIDFLCKSDRIILILIGWLGRYVAGRIVMIGLIKK